MDFKKYIYVSPQYYIQAIKEWNYEYIKDGKLRRSPCFGYHQGKDVIKNMEIDAWRAGLKVRMLTQFQWRDLCYTLLGGKYEAADGSKIIFHTKSQFKKFMMESERPGHMVKTLRQCTSGEIVLQHVLENDGRYLGFLSIIGKRGGVRREHNYCVKFTDDGEPCLVRKIGSLFDYYAKASPKYSWPDKMISLSSQKCGASKANSPVFDFS
jgi:hypothetical protein